MTYTVDVDSYLQSEVDDAELSAYCHDLFCSFARSDQRRWGEIYVRGLIEVPGRKSVRKISDLVAGGGAEQCLQQFVNQSTWDCGPVRRDLTYRLFDAIQPQAWVVKEVVFPKNGDRSVGVARQFVQSAGRLLNCQLGIAVFLAGARGSCPVNWRLLLPPAWDGDGERRRRARVPAEEHYQPTCRHILDAIDEMVTDWGLPPAPIVADIRLHSHVGALARGLESLGLRYVLRVAENRPAVTIRSAHSAPRTLSFGELIIDSIRRNTTAISRWQLPAGRRGSSQLIATRLPADSADLDYGHRVGHSAVTPVSHGLHPHSRPPRYVAAEWSSIRRSARASWLTTLDALWLPRLPELTTLYDRVDAELELLSTGSGLRHFEGRSFPGWHHYVTLVSVAHAWRYLCVETPSLSNSGETRGTYKHLSRRVETRTTTGDIDHPGHAIHLGWAAPVSSGV